MFLDAFVDNSSGSGVIFLMKLRCGGLLFRENGSMGDLGGLWGPNMSRDTMLLGVLGSILGGIFQLKNRSKIDVFFDMNFDMIFDRFLIEFGRLFGFTIYHF